MSGAAEQMHTQQLSKDQGCLAYSLADIVAQLEFCKRVCCPHLWLFINSLINALEACRDTLPLHGQAATPVLCIVCVCVPAHIHCVIEVPVFLCIL